MIAADEPKSLVLPIFCEIAFFTEGTRYFSQLAVCQGPTIHSGGDAMKYAHLARLSIIAAGLAVACFPMSAAFAQATRTWVSGVGDDANPCSRTAPCKTFAGAISKTATGGEINCLDPGGFGGLTITKSISIICDFTEGGVLSAGPGVNGFVINIPVTSSVFLSGLDFNGAGSAQNGLRIVSGGIVHIQNSIIRNYRASNGLGMSIQPAGALQMTIANTTIADNGTGATGGGMLIQPTGAGGSARVHMRNTLVQHNSNNQIRVDTTGNTGPGISLFVEESQITGGTNGININQTTPNVTAVITDSFIALGSGTGILTAGNASVRVRVSDTTVTAWNTGLTQGGTTVINTYGNNRFDGNGALGTFTLPAIPES
jgi:hypothetical protein